MSIERTISMNFEGRAVAVEVGDTWRLDEQPFDDPIEGATAVLGRLGLTGPIPHNGSNIIVDGAFGSGTLTSRGHPPSTWAYVHGEVLTPAASAAMTLASEASWASLTSTLAAVLVRAWVLARVRALPSEERTLLENVVRRLGATPVDEKAAQEAIVKWLSCVREPAASLKSASEMLRRQLSTWDCLDDDGAGRSLWRGDGFVADCCVPDVSGLEAGELPDVEDDDELRVYGQVVVEVRSES